MEKEKLLSPLRATRQFLENHPRAFVVLGLTGITSWAFASLIYRTYVYAYPTGKDCPWHLLNLELIYHALRMRWEGLSTRPLADILINRELIYAPTLYILALPFRAALAWINPYSAAMASRLVYIVLLAGSFYFLCRRFLTRPMTLLLTFSLCSSGAFFVSTVNFNMPLPTAACFIFFLTLVIYVPFFFVTWATVLGAIAFAFGMMNYHFFAVYALPVVLVTFFKGCNQSHWRWQPHFFQGAIFTIVTLALISPYYFNAQIFRMFYGEVVNFSGSPIPIDISARHQLLKLANYFPYLIKNSLPLWLGVPLCFFSRHPRRGAQIVEYLPLFASVFAFAIVFFTLFAGQVDEYLLPLLPLVFLFLGVALSNNPALPKVIIAFIALFFFISAQRADLSPRGIFNYREIHRAIEPVVKVCDNAPKPCRIFWGNCSSVQSDYFFVSHDGIHPNRRWTLPLNEEIFPEQIDFIIVDRGTLGTVDSDDLQINSWCPLRVRRNNDEFRLIYQQRDISGLFSKFTELKDNYDYLIVYRRKDFPG